jgi:hypothetical protein
MTESAYYESLGVFFNGADAEVYLNLLEQNKLPVKVEFLSLEDRPEEFFGLEIFTKKSAVEPAMKIKNDLIRKTLENKDVYIHQISEEELLKIPYHPEDANDFDYWAALELIKQKGLPLEERDWETFRQEKLIERFENVQPKGSGVPAIGFTVLALGVIMLAVTYKSLPIINLLFFAGSLLIGNHLTKNGNDFTETERKKGKLIQWFSFVMIGVTLVLSYLYMFG